jgi:hypothetical protein
MRISAQLGLIVSLVFAVVAFSVAAKGFLSLDEIKDATQRADSIGFAGFWAFLGLISAGFAALNYWIVKATGRKGP